MSELLNAAARAKTASFAMAALSEQTKNSALEAIAEALNERSAKIFDENKKDLDAAMKAELDGPLIKRLRFGAQKLAETTAEISSLISIEDPVGKVSLHTTLDEGLELYRVSCPIGVIGLFLRAGQTR